MLAGDDHVEIGSSLRTAAALGLGDVFLHGNGAGWFDGPHAARREARAAARRHKNPLRVRRAIPEFTDGFREIVLVAPHGPGRALGRERLARGRDQLVVIGLAPGPVQAAAPGRVRVATLNLEPVADAPLRLVASIALAEIARQAGRPAGRGPVPARRWPGYEREIKLAAPGEPLIIDPATLLSY
jgi:hypothetical protein